MSRQFAEVSMCPFLTCAVDRRLRHKLTASRFSWEESFVERGFSTQKSLLHYTSQRLTQIRRYRMSVVQVLLADLRLLLGIENNEVGIVSGRQLSLVSVASGELRRFLRHPACDVGKREGSLLGLGPHYGQGLRQAGDSSPGIPEASFIKALHCRRARRMIGNDHVNDAILQSLPKLLSIGVASDGRRALELRRALGDVLCHEMQVMRASLDSHRQTRTTSDV